MLKKLRDKLQEENERLKGDKELNDMMVQEKIVQVKQQKEQLRQVREIERQTEREIERKKERIPVYMYMQKNED